LEPDHASLYLLELYPNAPLREDMARAGWSQAPDEDAASMYLEALDRLDRAGYEHYEISNVSKPGRRARHNIKYWQDGEWLGFGCGAHSTRTGDRWRNVPATIDYVRRIAAGEPVVAERRTLEPDERVEDALFTGLRLTAGVDLATTESRYGIDVWRRYGPELARFVAAGLVIHEPKRRLALTRPGMLLANEVMAVFISPTVR
jgi:oxygen-independent coproporphyrinogen III oxidase